MRQVVIDGYPFTRHWIEGHPTWFAKYKELRAFLIERYKVCYWCGIMCINPKYVEGVKLPANTGTVDHIEGRITRGRVGKMVPKVLACSRCNEKRSVYQNSNKVRAEEIHHEN